MRIAIIYHSGGGNTHVLAQEIASRLPEAEIYRIKEFDTSTITDYDMLIIGTYTWGNGKIPHRMQPFYQELEKQDIHHIKTIVFGTGETGYKYYCGAVDLFRDMLYANSKLLATLKVEQMMQESDLPRVQKLCDIVKREMSL